MFAILLALSLLVVGHRTSKTVHRTPEFVPSSIKTLSALQETDFTTIQSSPFPRYGLRIKRSTFCDSAVKGYTGYIDVGTRHTFFYFFESRNKPASDPVLMWVDGGPGCSSALGLFIGMGPCKIGPSGIPHINPYSWNNNASVFFVDQPLGTGFSYSSDEGERGVPVSTTEEAASDIAAFIAIFFEHFSTFKGREFHMASSSYGGRYLPLFATILYDQNTRLADQVEPVNLKSIMIGNGLTDVFTMLPSYYDVQCSDIVVSPILGVGDCVRMKSAVPRCTRWMKDACLDRVDRISCAAAYAFCNEELTLPFYTTNKNPYDMRLECETTLGEGCYSIVKYTIDYLNRPAVRSALGVDSSITAGFALCSWAIERAFDANLDAVYPSSLHVAALLEHGIRVLVYNGDADWICNVVGVEAWTLAMDWSGHDEFAEQGLRVWTTFDGKPAGKTRSAKGLTFATIAGAGHIAPYDKPVQALAMVNRWIFGEDL